MNKTNWKVVVAERHGKTLAKSMISMLLEYRVMGAYVYKLARGCFLFVGGGALLATPTNLQIYLCIMYYVNKSILNDPL